ncbi:LOW QUALITY PROTEIN: major facilitator superfamily domain-containing protein 6-like [Dasypus novemcinctus]|uniref:LOW QUALITY PROTEIN: major facilitator superfamily domain-containing protein 6-like n=1 Tax=Dasypus novemcinctus TaxID=9361 RepID=UPI00265E36BD|nr:LOW QUALITY PROTEIN: major facilitator superfamily domain-containing protein 6-like [Dasypus novemcinctus]
MSANPQWDVRRALGVARLFQLACGARDACATPFLTLYLRQLGLAAPWVGVLLGTKHLLAAFWAPFCAFLAKTHQKRRVLLMGSLLGSVGASLSLVLVPPLDKELAIRSCNASRSGAAAVAPPGVSPPANATPTPEPAADPGAGARSRPAQKSAGTVHAPGAARDPGERGQEPPGLLPSALAGSAAGARTASQGLLQPVTSGAQGNSGESATEVVRTAGLLLPGDPEPGSPADLPGAKGQARAPDLSSEGLRRTFILCLASLVLWELLTAPLQQVADDSLYEYLDFVDATDRYRSLWVWGLLGTAAGACGSGALAGQLDCSLLASRPRGAVHLYGYALLGLLASLVSPAFPVPVCRRREPSHRAAKALSLLGGDPRLLLLALTVFLIGAATSTVQNFLFWHMEDHGSSELVMGFSVALGALGEILLSPLKTKLLKKLSRAGTVGLGLGCLAAQLLYYSLLWSWWSVLPAQILGAISNGALWWAVGASIEAVATPGTERALSAMFRGHFFGGGLSLGSFVGGFVGLRFGLPVLYRAGCVALLLWLALLLAVRSRLPQERKINYSKLLATEASDTSDSEEGTERDWLVKAMQEEHAGWKG